ncbi:YtpR family tRNA-binding protein [Alkalihalobacillus sp. AL-G]|uniref:YtpR family tRNA-binding protein n=1 Tax=Alkalihalobacillus sp. AL-G TaxID=2926399 RepID=UPI00272C150F|nr:DUF4479 domain-containing tRNA-binding protein [Alkalihalobacillus sp. AL-G]WLD92404.1 DUF4479 domain-containing protein [Alkalihalobacillus sp. AL-G]
MLNVYYNPDGVGDVLFVSVNGDEIKERDYTQTGDVVRIYDRQDSRTFGFNIFNATKHFDLEGNGVIDVTEELVQSINTLLKENDLDETLEFDSRPLFIVGHVESKEKHPDADKLSICHVNIGDETLQIVCGAPNVDKGQKVVVARVGAVMPGGLLIKEAELRGVPSSGMICSAKELNLPNAPTEKGILVLEDTYQVGSEFN